MKWEPDPRVLSCWRQDTSGQGRHGCGASALAKDRPLLELPDGKHFPGAGRAGVAQGQAERPQWTLVWRFSLDPPAGLAPGLGWAQFSDLQPDPAPKQLIPCPETGIPVQLQTDAHRLAACA